VKSEIGLFIFNVESPLKTTERIESHII